MEIESPVNLLGGQAPGNVGLRVDAQAKGITSASALYLSWNYDDPGANQKIHELRTAQDITSLDSAIYKGPNGTADWYDLSTSGATTTTETDGTKTTTVNVNAPYTPAAEIQIKLSSDGLSTPVLHSVTLSYESYPDLIVTNATVPSLGTIGSPISVSTTVANQGTGAADTSKVGIYLYNTAKETSYFLGDRTVAQLAAGASDSGSITVTIPTVPTGNYYLKACADYTNLVVEGNETNNCTLGNAISISSVRGPI